MDEKNIFLKRLQIFVFLNLKDLVSCGCCKSLTNYMTFRKKTSLLLAQPLPSFYIGH